MSNEYQRVKDLPNRIAIFDLDGCISDDEWRLQFIESSGKDQFVKYHIGLSEDKPLQSGIDRITSHYISGDAIVFITARPESVRLKTDIWLEKNLKLSSEEYCLFMRGDSEEGIGSVHLKDKMLHSLAWAMRSDQQIVSAYDDRSDIIEMYLKSGISGARILDKNGVREYVKGESIAAPFYEASQSAVPSQRTAADILEEAGKTFRERNAVYKDNADNVGKVMAALFPNGVQIKTAEDHKMYHLFELIIVKLTRFANSGLIHTDSIHDMAVYAAMCENLAATHNIQFKENK
jgi:hypothetical protein